MKTKCETKKKHSNFERKKQILFWTLFTMDYEASIIDSMFPRKASGKTQKPQSWIESAKILAQSVSYTATLRRSWWGEWKNQMSSGNKNSISEENRSL